MSVNLVNLAGCELRIVVELRPPTLVVALSGELDYSACGDLLEAVTQVQMAGITHMVVDLEELSFCDVAGLRTLLRFRSVQVEDGRTIRVLRPQPHVVRLAALFGQPELLAAARDS